MSAVQSIIVNLLFTYCNSLYFPPNGMNCTVIPFELTSFHLMGLIQDFAPKKKKGGASPPPEKNPQFPRMMMVKQTLSLPTLLCSTHIPPHLGPLCSLADMYFMVYYNINRNFLYIAFFWSTQLNALYKNHCLTLKITLSWNNVK